MTRYESWNFKLAIVTYSSMHVSLRIITLGFGCVLLCSNDCCLVTSNFLNCCKTKFCTMVATSWKQLSTTPPPPLAYKSSFLPCLAYFSNTAILVQGRHSTEAACRYLSFKQQFIFFHDLMLQLQSQSFHGHCVFLQLTLVMMLC